MKISKKIPFVDLKANYLSIKPEIDEAIQNILDNTAFIKGDALKLFEEKWAKKCNAGYSIGISSGTSSLELIINGYGFINKTDEIICPSHTFTATAEAICNCGAVSVFADIDYETALISAQSVEKLITKNTKAIIIVDLYGQPADFDSIKLVLQNIGRDDIKIIEDAAQSHLAIYKGKVVGSYADATSFSFYPGKNMGAYGDAGAVVTNDKVLAKKIKMLSDHGRVDKYVYDLIGSNSRMDNLQAAILNVKMNHIDEWTKKRQVIAKFYRDNLDKVKFQPITQADFVNSAYHLFVVKLNASIDRDEFRNYLSENNISSGVHYPIPLHLQPAYKEFKSKTDFQNTEKLTKQIISLPIFPEMTEEQMKYIVVVANNV